MINNKKCAAVLLNYNDADNAITLADELKTYSSLDCIIIVDNCSSDDSWERLLKCDDKKIIVVKTDKNGGYGYGNNFGIKYAWFELGCELAFICNSDIKVEEICFTAIGNELSYMDDLVICSAIQINGYTNKQIDYVAWKIPTTFDYIRNSLVLIRHIIPQFKYTLEEDVIKVDCVPGAFLGVDVRRFLDSGGYDENMFLFCEESTIAARTKNKGYTTCLMTNYCYYHFHSTSIKKSIPKMINTFKLTIQSRRYYLIHYRKLKGIGLAFTDLLLNIGILEQLIIDVFNRFRSRAREHENTNT